MIDTLNPNLRSIDYIEGKKRVREFYAMDAQEAYSLLESIATINGLTHKLHKVKPTDKELSDDKEANIARLESFKFSMCNIPVGAELEYTNDPTKKCYVLNDKMVEYEGNEYSLSSLAKLLKGTTYDLQGPRFFKYNGVPLNELRAKMSDEEI